MVTTPFARHQANPLAVSDGTGVQTALGHEEIHHECDLMDTHGKAGKPHLTPHASAEKLENGVRAGVAELADATDSKSVGAYTP